MYCDEHDVQMVREADCWRCPVGNEAVARR